VQKIQIKAQEILDSFDIYHSLPASISGKYHIGESHKQHIDLSINVMSHLCGEFNIVEGERDLLLGATMLHDIGLYVITKKGKVDLVGWEYYEATGYSRITACMQSHGSIGADVLEPYEIDRKKEIQRLISIHMSHWYKNQPQPNNLYEYLICIADYTASRGSGILEYNQQK